MPLHVSSTCAHHQEEVKIALHSLWYHHTYRWPSRAQVESGLVGMHSNQSTLNLRGCVMQFWPSDDEHMCSKHVEAWNKLIVKQTFCASSWLITEINILRCTVSKTSKNLCTFFWIIGLVVILDNGQEWAKTFRNWDKRLWILVPKIAYIYLTASGWKIIKLAKSYFPISLTVRSKA